jgi:hypothetical protein
VKIFEGLERHFICTVGSRLFHALKEKGVKGSCAFISKFVREAIIHL